MKELQKAYGFGLYALHINHNWRGKESDLEATACEKFCKDNGINFYCEKLSAKIKHDENSARNARYELFDKYSGIKNPYENQFYNQLYFQEYIYHYHFHIF